MKNSALNNIGEQPIDQHNLLGAQQMETSRPDFGSLLLSSSSLTAHITTLPQLPRGLETIEEQSKALLKNKNIPPTTNTRLQELERLLKEHPVSAATHVSFEDAAENQTEDIILNCIEEVRLRAIETANKFFDEKMSSNWTNTKARIFAELGQHRQVSYKPQSSLVDTPKIAMSITSKGCARVVAELNEARLLDRNYSLISNFKRLADKSVPLVGDCWQLLSNIFGENGDFKDIYLATQRGSGESVEAINWRNRVTDGSRRFLSMHFFTFVEKSIQAARVEVGGMPSDDVLIFKSYSKWKLTTLITNKRDKAIWAHLFYLMRAGKLQEAERYCAANESDFSKTDAYFIGYFREWVSGGKLGKRSREAMLLFWNAHVKPTVQCDQKGNLVAGDPFFYAVYKIIGRFDLERKSVPGREVLPSTEDYIWFQLMLVREEFNDEVQDGFTLRDCAKNIRKFGAQHFSANGRNPMTYALVLLLCGEFEQCVGYLFSTDAHRLEAIHFGIALMYHGTLRTPDSPYQVDGAIRYLTTKNLKDYELSFLNFHHLLNQYARQFSQSNPQDALHYIYTIGLLSNEYFKSAQTFIIDIVIENMALVDTLLGTVRQDSTRLPGIIDKYAKLVGLNSPIEFQHAIIKEAAVACDYTGRYIDAIRLFDLCGNEFESIFAILNKRLGEHLVQLQSALSVFSTSKPQSPKKSANTLINQKTQELLNVAGEVLLRFSGQKSAAFRGCSLFISLFDFMNQVGLGYFEQAISIMDSLAIFPTRDEAVARTASLSVGLDENVGRALPVIIHTYMTALGKLYTLKKNQGRLDGLRVARLDEIKTRARALIVYAAHVQYKLPSDVYGQLMRIEADMS